MTWGSAAMALPTVYAVAYCYHVLPVPAGVWWGFPWLLTPIALGGALLTVGALIGSAVYEWRR